MTGAEGEAPLRRARGGFTRGMSKPAVYELTPTVYRVPTKPFDLVNSFVGLDVRVPRVRVVHHRPDQPGDGVAAGARRRGARAVRRPRRRRGGDVPHRRFRS